MVRIHQDHGRHHGWEIGRRAQGEAGARRAQEVGPAAPVGSASAPSPTPGTYSDWRPNAGLVIDGNNQSVSVVNQAAGNLVDSAADTVLIDGNNNAVSIVNQAGGDIIDTASDTIIIDGNNNVFRSSSRAGGDILDLGNDTIIIKGNNNLFESSLEAGGDIVDRGNDTIIIDGNNNVFRSRGRAGGDIIDDSSDTAIIKGNNNVVGGGEVAGGQGAQAARLRRLIERVQPEPLVLDLKLGDEIANRVAEAKEQVEAFRAFLESHLRAASHVPRPWEVRRVDQAVLDAYVTASAREGRGLKLGHLKKSGE